MKKVFINRFYGDLNTCLGVLTLDELDYPLYTCENAWHFNAKDKSCIYDGIFKIKPYKSPKFGDCLIIEDVEGRTYILAHVGNIHKNTLGCVLIGLETGRLKGVPAVLNSREALKLLCSIIKEERELHIKSSYI